MKPYIKIWCYLIILICVPGFAQNSNMTLENLKSPSMPAATIIGIQVNEVNRPKSLKALETAVFTNYLNADQSFIIPNNYALEFNPFMLSGRKNFDYTEYLSNEVLANIWRNLSLSVASTNEFPINDSTSISALGFGIRTIILNGEPNNKIAEVYESALVKNQDMLRTRSVVRTLISAFIKENASKAITIDTVYSSVLRSIEQEGLNNYRTIISSVFNEMNRDTPISEIEETFVNIYNEKIATRAFEQLKKALHEVKTERYGVRWEMDFAYALSFPANNFDDNISPRWGLWTNVSYQTEQLKGFTFIGLGRFLINNDECLNRYRPIDESLEPGNLYDFGARLVYEHDKFSIEFEYIHRLNNNKIKKIIDGEEYERNINDNTNKYILNVNYNINDNISISYNIGKNFDDISDAKGNLISGLIFNFGFGDIKAGDLLPKK